MSAAILRRLNALESRLLASVYPEMQPGPISLADGSEHGKIFACMAPKQPKLSGWPDFASKTRWLSRSTCEFADGCSFSKTCAADGAGVGSATHAIA